MSSTVHMHEVLPYSFNAIVMNPRGEIIRKQHVKGESQKYKVIYNENTTIVILPDGTKGVAWRNPKDPYNRQIGHDIAFNRAKIKRLQKEIEKISSTSIVKNRRLSPDYL
jgi:hypothetical protein